MYSAFVLLRPGFGAPFVAALRTSVPWALNLHIVGGLTALAVGPWQFNRRLRARAVGMHRWMGRVYVGSAVVGSAGGLVLAPMSQEGIVAHLGFGFLAVFWLMSTTQALRRIRAGDVDAHRRWMIRSFSLTLAAVTLRIYLPLAAAAGIPFHDVYRAVAWLCWVPNLLVAEALIWRDALVLPAQHVNVRQ